VTLEASAVGKRLIPATRLLPAGPPRVNPEDAPRRCAARGASNGGDGPACARGPSDLNGGSLRRDLTIDAQLNLSWTYETLY
jgi:hypothetical protein